MLVALAHATVLEKEGLGSGAAAGKAGSEAVAGRLELAAQLVKQVRAARACVLAALGRRAGRGGRGQGMARAGPGGGR